MTDLSSHPEHESLSQDSVAEDRLDELFGGESSANESDMMEVDEQVKLEVPEEDVKMESMAQETSDVAEERERLNKGLFGDDDSEDESANQMSDDEVVERRKAKPSKSSKRRNVLGKKEVTLADAPDLSTLEPYAFKLPGFIFVEEEEYSRQRMESEELAVLEQGPQGNYPKDALLRMSASIRWRTHPVSEKVETNARIIKWSDGSLSLSVGEEQFEVMKQNTQKENCYLYTRHANEGCMEAAGKLEERLAVRPFVTSDQSHRKFLAISTSYVQSTAHPSGREQAKVKMAVTTADPEREKQRMIKLEAEKIKSKRKVEARRRNIQSRSYERVARTGLSARFLEEDEGGALGAGGEDMDLDRYEDDFIDDTGNVDHSEEESSEDTDYRSDNEDQSSSEESNGSEDDESTAQESEISETEEEEQKKSKQSKSKKKQSTRKSGKIIESDQES